jgi:hypothetical protein
MWIMEYMVSTTATKTFPAGSRKEVTMTASSSRNSLFTVSSTVAGRTEWVSTFEKKVNAIRLAKKLAKQSFCQEATVWEGRPGAIRVETFSK